MKYVGKIDVVIAYRTIYIMWLWFTDATEGDDTTLYLWGMGGNRTMLPPNTGFKVIIAFNLKVA